MAQHKPIYVAFQYFSEEGPDGMGYQLFEQEEIISKPIKGNAELVLLRNLIKEAYGFKEVVIINFRRMEAEEAKK